MIWRVLQIAAGLVLTLYLPGTLAVAALFRERLDPYLRVVLSIALSLVTTMLIGLVVASTRLGFGASTVSAGLLAMCVLLAVVAAIRRPSKRLARSMPRIRWRHVLAGVPVLVLTVLLVVAIVAAARYRSADSYYTELDADRSGGGTVVIVACHERHSMRYRYEERVDGGVSRTERFALQPGQQVQFAVSGSTGHVEVTLYRDGLSGPYRRLKP
jgi:uncharacterized membrane protein